MWLTKFQLHQLITVYELEIDCGHICFYIWSFDIIKSLDWFSQENIVVGFFKFSVCLLDQRPVQGAPASRPMAGVISFSPLMTLNWIKQV